MTRNCLHGRLPLGLALVGAVGLMMVCSGCNRNPYASPYGAAPYGTTTPFGVPPTATWQTPTAQAGTVAGYAQPQLAELERRVQQLDVNNRQLTTQLAQSQQQMQVFRDRADLLQRQLQDTAAQLQQSRMAQQDLQNQARGIQASISQRGGATLRSNTSAPTMPTQPGAMQAQPGAMQAPQGMPQSNGMPYSAPANGSPMNTGVPMNPGMLNAPMTNGAPPMNAPTMSVPMSAPMGASPMNSSPMTNQPVMPSTQTRNMPALPNSVPTLGSPMAARGASPSGTLASSKLVSSSSASGMLASTPSAMHVPGAQVQSDGNALRVRIPSDQLFSPGTAQLNSAGAQVLDAAAVGLTRFYPRQRVAIEGHTDAGTLYGGAYGNSAQLASAQAQAVMDQLVKRNGIPAQQLFIVSHGTNQPLADNNTAAGRAQNRRIELVIYPETF